MEMQEIIRQAEANIRQAVRDYGEHTYQKTVLEDISDAFIERLAEDSSYAKQGLRELFSKSPVWDANLDALIINGTRTHDPDHQRIRDLARRILRVPLLAADPDKCRLILDVIDFFPHPDYKDDREAGIRAMDKLAPKAYKPGKKLSRVFKAIRVELGVADETAGSEFQHLYAQFADELTARKIGFKLFVSINPAHFLTMSNPKRDERGQCLTSCHSLNSTEYEYNCGCTGYARDDVSFIVFTVDDPADPETLNNRKTTRQIFAYKPGNGVLLQSRMYNTSGGVYGAVEDSKLYRDLVQREISALEGAPNLWKVSDSTSQTGRSLVFKGSGFGGYPDWEFENFDGKVCVRFDHADDCESLVIGTWGLCVRCGEEINDGMYCKDCRCVAHCDDCEEGVTDEDGLYTVYDSDGNERRVCSRCLEAHYTYCDRCGEYHADSVMKHIDGENVCLNCVEEYYEKCADCGELVLHDETYRVIDEDGDGVNVCEYCHDRHYETCSYCGEDVHEDLMRDVFNEGGDSIRVCEDCYEKYIRDDDLEEAV